MTAAPVLVVGLGALDAGDDAAGPLVAEAVRRRGQPHIEVLVHEDPTDLTLVWRRRDRVVVVDALRGADPPGSVRVLRVGAHPAYDPSTWPAAHSAGTHDFGLVEAVELSRALGTMPGDLLLVGVSGSRFDVGEPMSPAVREALPGATDLVVSLATEGLQHGSVPAGPLPAEPTSPARRP